MPRPWLVFAAALAACYHPKIADGTIYCSGDVPPKCPSGLQCAADGLCYKKPPVITPMPYGDGSLGAQDLGSFGGVLILHTNTGQIVLHDPTSGSDMEIVPASTAPFGTPQTNGPPVALWSFTELIIPGGMLVQVSADSRAVPVLAATQLLTMNGAIQLIGNGGENGAANGAGANPFGGDGSGGGGAAAASLGGGGGGGHSAAGGAGDGTGGGAGGPLYGGTQLPVFFGAGGGGGGSTGSAAVPGFGGTGGGAVVLLSAIVDVQGIIDVSGGDGEAASLADPMTPGDAGGGGGGAGGTILISGATITLGPTASLVALGGKGGAPTGNGGQGGDGAAGVIELAGSVSNTGMSMPSANADTTALPAFPK